MAMNHAALARAFRRILVTTMPASGATLLVACGGTTGVSPMNGQPDGQGGVDAWSDANGSGGSSSGSSGSSGSGSGSGGGSGSSGSSSGGIGGDDASGGDDATVIEADAYVPPDAARSDVTPEGTDGGGPITDSGDGGDATIIMTSCGPVVTPPGPPFLHCYPECFPLDAGALASVDAGDSGLLGFNQCAPLCGPGFWFSCEPFVDGGVSQIRCHPQCTGRRPEGLLASEAARGAPLGAYFAEMARLEAASVDAFRHLRRELIAHGAPPRLVRAAERAARDEIRHARMAESLARRYGAVAIEPRVEPRAIRSLEAISVENAVEGCAREAFGALIAGWQAIAARDPIIRPAMARIARDETRHAALAFQVNAWVKGRLSAAMRARVEGARQRALEELASGSEEAPLALRLALGLPTSQEARLLAQRMARLAA
jgi:hypothetical protein